MSVRPRSVAAPRWDTSQPGRLQPEGEIDLDDSSEDEPTVDPNEETARAGIRVSPAAGPSEEEDFPPGRCQLSSARSISCTW